MSKDGVSKDRMMSVHDPEMAPRAAANALTGTRRRLWSIDSQLIYRRGGLPGNAPDNLGAWNWWNRTRNRKPWAAAYGTVYQPEPRRCGQQACYYPGPRPAPTGGTPLGDVGIDLAAWQLHLSGGAGGARGKSKRNCRGAGDRQAFSSTGLVCTKTCPGLPSASQPRAGRGGGVLPCLLQEAREKDAARAPAYDVARRVVVNRLARLDQFGFAVPLFRQGQDAIPAVSGGYKGGGRSRAVGQCRGRAEAATAPISAVHQVSHADGHFRSGSTYDYQFCL